MASLLSFESFAPHIAPQVDAALREDLGDGDHSSLACIPPDHSARVRMIVKDQGIVAGMALCAFIAQRYDPELSLQVLIPDGSPIREGDIALTLEGRSHSLLALERTLLNYVQRLSGIATHTRAHVDRIAHTRCQLLDTRKTTPGLRLLEKWAVGLGGGVNHRIGLYDAIMLKDNHIDLAGGIPKAMERTRLYLAQHQRTLPIIVEVRTLEELEQALAEPGIDRILIDNFPLDRAREAVQITAGQIPLEASGGIDLDTIAAHADTGVDFVSVGGLTHRFRSLDLSLKAF
ncbi:carboxylating nicotinate-nucleotide diphosphorylase [bacterium]|nr:carboxylating nicotinate-nucleotide diphosphorylase [bacterium]